MKLALKGLKDWWVVEKKIAIKNNFYRKYFLITFHHENIFQKIVLSRFALNAKEAVLITEWRLSWMLILIS